jgi:hypothetical protein
MPPGASPRAGIAADHYPSAPRTEAASLRDRVYLHRHSLSDAAGKAEVFIRRLMDEAFAAGDLALAEQFDAQLEISLDALDHRLADLHEGDVCDLGEGLTTYLHPTYPLSLAE